MILLYNVKQKQNKNFADFTLKKNCKSNFVRGKFLKIRSSITLPLGHAILARPIGSAVLTFIGHKQTRKHLDMQVFGSFYKKCRILGRILLRKLYRISGDFHFNVELNSPRISSKNLINFLLSVLDSSILSYNF